MTTEAQTQANRENARKSTGPRTEAGKARSRLNALKHGRRAKTLAAPVLPQEDAAELARRIQDWIDSYRPVGAVETDLVTRAARASWALDRAERCEAALLSRRVRRALVDARARRVARVGDLGRKLLYMTGKRILPGSGPDWTDDPAGFVAELESISEGARWLRDRWAEIHALILADEPWTYLDQFKFVRLSGKQPFSAVDDPAVNAVFLAWEAIEEGWGVRFWKLIQEHTPHDDPAFSAWRTWRAVAPRPADKAAGVAFLLAAAAAEIERLDARVAELEAADGDDALETAERASFHPGDDAERLRRSHAARSRELTRALDTLNRLRKESAALDKKAAKAAPAPAPIPKPEPETTPPPIKMNAAPAPSPAPTAVAVDPDEAPPTFQAVPVVDGPDAVAIKLLRGSRRETSDRANEAAATVAKVVSRDELAWSRCDPFPRERTRAADPGLRRKVANAVVVAGMEKADGPRGALSNRRPRRAPKADSEAAIGLTSASSPSGGSRGAS